MDLCMNNPKAACKKINYVATDCRKKIMFDREQKILKELELKFGDEIVLFILCLCVYSKKNSNRCSLTRIESLLEKAI
jgi:hypothetical protein